jgi:hypothetical protein
VVAEAVPLATCSLFVGLAVPTPKKPRPSARKTSPKAPLL